MISGQVAVIFIVMVVVCWMINEWEVAKRKYTKSEKVSRKAKINNHLLLLATILSFVGLFLSLYLNTNYTTFGFYPNFILSYTGSFLALMGIILRRVAINTLSHHFDSLIQVKENQKLIQHGIYKKIRHPSYAASILTFFGFGVASMNIVNMLLFPTMFILLYHFRIKMEEEVLEEGFGDEYRMYKEQSSALFPTMKFKKRNKEVEKTKNT